MRYLYIYPLFHGVYSSTTDLSRSKSKANVKLNFETKSFNLIKPKNKEVIKNV